MLPAILRSSRALPLLSTLSVGLTMASLTGLVAGQFAGPGDGFSQLVLLTAPSTLAVGTAWAALLRWRRTVGRTRVRLGWLLSVPLAALNGGLTGALMLADKGLSGGLLGLALGMTAGSFVWAPAMVVTLLVFGIPIAWSQRQSRRGLAGAERGEIGVGLVCLLVSALCLVSLMVDHEVVWSPPLPGAPNERMVLPVLREGQLGAFFLCLVSALGVASSVATTALATLRGRRRRQLIEAAEAGERPDYRVERTPAGRVLIRVRPAATDDYRQADADDESFALDEAPPADSPASPRLAASSHPAP